MWQKGPFLSSLPFPSQPLLPGLLTRHAAGNHRWACAPVEAAPVSQGPAWGDPSLSAGSSRRLIRPHTHTHTRLAQRLRVPWCSPLRPVSRPTLPPHLRSLYLSSPPGLSLWRVELGPHVRPFFLAPTSSPFWAKALRPHVWLPSKGVTAVGVGVGGWEDWKRGWRDPEVVFSSPPQATLTEEGPFASGWETGLPSSAAGGGEKPSPWAHRARFT